MQRSREQVRWRSAAAGLPSDGDTRSLNAAPERLQRCSRVPVLQQSGSRFRVCRPAEEIALRDITIPLRQGARLGRGFDALGHGQDA